MQAGPAKQWCVASVSLLLCHGTTVADSWGRPTESEVTSQNGKFVARTVPSKRDTNAHAIVFAARGNERQELWRTDLSNRIAPVRAFLADDASALVTMDNWHAVGYGNDVVAIYARTGLVARYSLEQFVSPAAGIKPNVEDERAAFDGVMASLETQQRYRDKFSHSVSSRRWNEYSIQFFLRESDRLLFCVWLDWETRWVIWNIADGALIPVTPNQTQNCNLHGRAHALAEIKSGKARREVYNFLGRMKFQQDRPFIEKWLKDTQFWPGGIATSGENHTDSDYVYTSESNQRREADRILARWDALIDDKRPWYSRDYFFLGRLRGIIRLPVAPLNEGTLRIYLIPIKTPLTNWAASTPEHHLLADFKAPYRFKNARETVKFEINGVTPGKYRLKAVWDRRQPHCDKNAVLCAPSPGDCVSTTSPVIHIKKGRLTENIQIACMDVVR